MKAAIQLRKTLADHAFNTLKGMGVNRLLQFIGDVGGSRKLQAQLEMMPVGTVGRAVAEAVNSDGYELIPGYHAHDLKHVLLNYPMTPEGEVELQAFMLGNGNRSLSCLLSLPVGLLMPDQWSRFAAAFRRGKATPSLLGLRLEEVADMPLNKLQAQFFPQPGEA